LVTGEDRPYFKKEVEFVEMEDAYRESLDSREPQSKRMKKRTVQPGTRVFSS